MSDSGTFLVRFFFSIFIDKPNLNLFKYIFFNSCMKIWKKCIKHILSKGTQITYQNGFYHLKNWIWGNFLCVDDPYIKRCSNILQKSIILAIITPLLWFYCRFYTWIIIGIFFFMKHSTFNYQFQCETFYLFVIRKIFVLVLIIFILFQNYDTINGTYSSNKCMWFQLWAREKIKNQVKIF